MKENVLDLDVGNSFTKWRMATQRGTIVTGTLPTVGGVMDRVRVSTVAVAETQLREQISEQYQVDAEFAKTTPSLGGVTNGYSDYKQLGVDRWLALTAAWHKCQSDLLVFDLGTAMTVDYVRADGTHLGGYIVGGPSAMRQTLSRCTRDVRVPENQDDWSHCLEPARNTEDAVNFGLVHFQEGFIQKCIGVGVPLFGGEPELILTGGDLAHPSIGERFPFQICTELVLDGLELALP